MPSESLLADMVVTARPARPATERSQDEPDDEDGAPEQTSPELEFGAAAALKTRSGLVGLFDRLGDVWRDEPASGARCAEYIRHGDYRAKEGGAGRRFDLWLHSTLGICLIYLGALCYRTAQHPGRQKVFLVLLIFGIIAFFVA